MRNKILLVVGLLVAWLMLGAVLLYTYAHAQANCQTAYNNACIGATVCWNANQVSQLVIPQNLNRHYLLIQNQSTTSAAYFAICTATTCTAVINTNTIQLVPNLSNYELNSLNAGAPGQKVATGSIAIIAPAGAPIPVCITEGNG